MKRWWKWLTVCLWWNHDWQTDPVPVFDEEDQENPVRFEIYTPSSTCRRCGARSY